MVGTQGKTEEQITHEVIQAKEKFVATTKKVTEDTQEKPLLSSNELSFEEFVNSISSAK